MFRFVLLILLGLMTLPTVLFAQSTEDEATKPEFVMILSSYAYEDEWSTTLAREIRTQLEKHRPNLKTNVTYAGIAAYTSFLADRFAMQGAFGQGRLSNKIARPNVLILIGDESWMLYRIMNLRGIWENIPVVLCGMYPKVLNDYGCFFPDKQLSGASFISLKSSASALRTTAVIESDNTKQTLELARTLVPNLQRVYYLSDGSYADCYMRDNLLRNGKLKDLSFAEIQIRRSNSDSVRQVLATLPTDVVVLTNGAPVPQDVSVPVITMRDVDFGSSVSVGGYFAPISSFANKTSEAVLHILETGEVSDIPYKVAPDTAFYLNQTILMRLGLRSTVKNLTNVVDRNVPPPFILRNIRIIAILLLIAIVLAFVLIRMNYAYRFRKNLNVLLKRYRTLYDEYQVVYENMPIGLMLFDMNGNLLNRNAETNVFLKHFAHSQSTNFHLFDYGILDETMQKSLLNKELVSRLLYLDEYCYRIQCCVIVDEETGVDQIMVVVVDNTDIDKEQKGKEQIYSVLNFVMNKAVIGVAQYNLVDGQGFATDAWYDILDIERGSANLIEMRQCLVPVDREKLNNYFEQIRSGASHFFVSNLQIQTRDGESHYVRILIQPLEFDLEKKCVVIAELLLNVDEQVKREHDLELAMRKAQEADRFKNAFVANMQDEIRVPLQEVISCSQELISTEDSAERNRLKTRIEIGNNRMLKLLNDIIEVSKVELNE